ncbi:type II secretion system protein [Pelomonas sp. BJYL3]|uniref:type II secretion system protein n=1 Tax=Pelomonas sp. BJYL3 TaxID=2976697 RepID=UPI0022B36EC1|nr:type II secretion system protein [Pelomonas sp. BJYL3]
MTHTQQRGISLIEVIVALVVISGFGAALFVWAGQTLKTASRAMAVLDEIALESNITEFAVSLNPAVAGQGRMDLGSQVYEWSSKLERDPADHVRHPAGISPYQVSVYAVKVRVLDKQSGRLLGQGERRVAGYKQVRVRPSGPPGFNTP